ncbi:synaptonemal complex protein 2-like isoform X3 [Synchiropus splendidus]|uniref:synaptonemal complex protein 2-like isoform X3 n=1 Tax=Synchiropus splendidus TaxID=270530 RepID=UPI00237DDD63|nr:synaptonemal complex protein 2-like isoform X3 [Synchiropus splendidus]
MAEVSAGRRTDLRRRAFLQSLCSDRTQMETLLEEHLQRADPAGVVSLIHFEGLNHSAVVQLDLLVTKLLSRSHFHKVSVLLKALERLTWDGTLVQLGLPAKASAPVEEALEQAVLSDSLFQVCFWFRAVSRRLTSDPPTETLHCLTESFYDYFLCLSQTSLPVHQLSAVLSHLTELAVKPDMYFSLGLEAIRTFNAVLDCLSPERRRRIQVQKNQAQILYNPTRTATMARLPAVSARALLSVSLCRSQLSTAVLTAADYELQVGLTEALCRLTPRKKRLQRARGWFPQPGVCAAFCDIRDGDFELDCRRFLNFLNRCRSDQMRVRTFPCRQTFLDSAELCKPKDKPLEPFWIDFNTGSKSVTFFTDDPQSCLWSSVHLSSDNVDQYSIRLQKGECTSASMRPARGALNPLSFLPDSNVPQSVLRVHLISPITHLGNTGQTVKILFNPEDHQDLEESLKAVFLEGEKSSKARRCLRVLPLSPSNKQPTSEPRRKSRAEALFDLVVPSTASYNSGVLMVPDPDSQERGSPSVSSRSRKRSLPDSGLVSDRNEDGCSPKLRREEEGAQRRKDTSASPGNDGAKPTSGAVPKSRGAFTVVFPQDSDRCCEDGDQPGEESEGPQLTSTSAGFTRLVQNLKGGLMESWRRVEEELQKPLSQCQQRVASLLQDVRRHSLESWRNRRARRTDLQVLLRRIWDPGLLAWNFQAVWS